MAVAQTRIKTLLCPGDDPYASTKGTVYAAHFFNFGQGWNFYAPSWDYSNVPAAANLGRTSYLGVGGAFGRGTRSCRIARENGKILFTQAYWKTPECGGRLHDPGSMTDQGFRHDKR
jgi:hypothetical protein